MRAMETALPEWLATQRNLMVSKGMALRYGTCASL